MVPRPKPSLDPRIADEAPTVPELTNYDYELLICYLRLLDAEADGADWRDVVRLVLKADPDRDYIRARRRYETHLARARWMTEHGYRHLLTEADDEW
ncbi:MAG: DUF2285 domain-containing protein [Alphaproteobacteria bacterium]|nr:DUF2285 domain-containing protein [Alphaproteobacteria bacterium]